MLMRFGVSNYRSFLEYQEISLVASSLKDRGTDLIEPAQVHERILPSILIYGANASGKSNVLAAMTFLRRAILQSQKSSSPTSSVPRRPFLLSSEGHSRPTQLDCDFVVDGVRYNFGFIATDDAFIEEWLFAFPEGKRRKWYYRKEGEKISFGKHFTGKNQSIAALTRPNVLFLSAAAHSAHAQATRIFNYFEKQWRPVVFPSLNTGQLAEQLASGVDNRIVDFLRLADTGIKSAKVQEAAAPEEVTKLFDRLKTVVDTEFSEIQFKPMLAKSELSLAHYGADEATDDVYMNVTDESRGTLRLLKLLQPLFETLDSGGLLFVDEIDSSLHTLLAQSLLRLFSSRSTNKLGAQLIATTHDTNLLCADCLRRDQIWFAEKDRNGATHLFPLTDIKTRNTDNLEKGYLQGRFGAVPFVGPIEKLLAERA